MEPVPALLLRCRPKIISQSNHGAVTETYIYLVLGVIPLKYQALYKVLQSLAPVLI
jgi:hypothetical protein